MTPYTDFLTYKEGVYSRTGEAFKFNGNHIVKVVGWESTPDGQSAWIVQNNWGLDWGEDGYGRVGSGGETMLDFYAIGFAAYPTTMENYYAQQQAAQQQQQFTINQNEIDDEMIIDLDNDIFNSDEFEEDKEQIYEEGVDSEL
jgi:C1A family cysteine protease